MADDIFYPAPHSVSQFQSAQAFEARTRELASSWMIWLLAGSAAGTLLFWS